MKLYLYNYIEDLTNSYHSGGGLVIITDGEPKFSRPAEDPWYWDEEEDGPMPMEEVALPEPTLVLDVPDAEPGVYVFPDSGCC